MELAAKTVSTGEPVQLKRARVRRRDHLCTEEANT
jgi:hypothetical protein